MHICIIANPISGGDSSIQISLAVKWFQSHGASVELLKTQSPGHAEVLAALARTEKYDRVVVAGGDGTLNEVINGLAPSTIPVAFLPLGTTNVFALEAGIPSKLEAACKVALEGKPKPVTLGVVNKKRFLLMAGAGFDAAAVRNVNLALKKRVGKIAYVFSALITLIRAPLPSFNVINCDGRKQATCQVLVSNARFYGGRFRFTPEASVHTPIIHVCIVNPMTRMRFIITIIALSFGLALPGVSRYSTTQLRLEGNGIPLQIDGDNFGDTPCLVNFTEGEIQMISTK